MKIKTFKVEQWMGEFENDAVYNLGETCIDSLTVKELIAISLAHQSLPQGWRVCMKTSCQSRCCLLTER